MRLNVGEIGFVRVRGRMPNENKARLLNTQNAEQLECQYVTLTLAPD